MMSNLMLLKEENTPLNLLRDSGQLSLYLNERYPDWLCQIKENGERTLISVKQGRIVGMRGRNNNPQLYLYPELKTLQIACNEALIDCEVVIEREGKTHFYNLKDEQGKITQAGIQYRSRSLKEDNKHPVKLVVFDLLKLDDEVLVTKPYHYRWAKLRELIKDNELIRVAENYLVSDAWNRVVEKDLEGVVLKNPNSVYELGKRSDNNIKVKNYKTTKVIVEASELNDKGVKITGKTAEGCIVECQIANAEHIETGQEITIKYLDKIGNKLIQPTKITNAQIKVMA